MKHFRLYTKLSLSTLALFFTTQTTHASGFQIWEQDGATLGEYHAGYAAKANDASTAFYNPAGIVRIKNQQIVAGGTSISSSFKYKGTVAVNNILGGAPQTVTAQGGQFSIVPFLHYTTPLTDNLGFGFSVDVPFGLKTNYGNNTFLRYAATLTSVSVVDISPSLAYKLNDKTSLGFGIDAQRMEAQFNLYGGFATPYTYDTWSRNTGYDVAYGYHFGGLYEFNPQSRIGLSYHSKVPHHLSGWSKFTGPLASPVLSPQGAISSRAWTNITLPAYTAISFYQMPCPTYSLMASVIYTQWNSFNNLILNNVSGRSGGAISHNIQVVIPERYRNTFNISVGSEYFATDKITLRGGLAFDQTPISNTYRNVQLPDNNRYIIAAGGHYQANSSIGLDVGWAHIFVADPKINPPVLVVGDQQTTTRGRASGGADVLSGQVTWDIT